MNKVLFAPLLTIALSIPSMMHAMAAEDLTTQLFQAIDADSLETVSSLLSKGPIVDAYDKRHYATPLAEAVKKKKITIAACLIDHKANVNLPRSDGWTPLIIAAQENDMKSAELLIKNGADVHARNRLGRNALLYAAWNNNLAIVRLLVENGADVNDCAKYTGETPLIAAQHFPDSILFPCTTDKMTGIDWPLVMEESIKNHAEITKYLLAAGSDVNALCTFITKERTADSLVDKIIPLTALRCAKSYEEKPGDIEWESFGSHRFQIQVCGATYYLEELKSGKELKRQWLRELKKQNDLCIKILREHGGLE